MKEVERLEKELIKSEKALAKLEAEIKAMEAKSKQKNEEKQAAQKRFGQREPSGEFSLNELALVEKHRKADALAEEIAMLKQRIQEKRDSSKESGLIDNAA